VLHLHLTGNAGGRWLCYAAAARRLATRNGRGQLTDGRGGPVINKRVILATAPIVYAAAIVGMLFTNTTAFIVVACVGAMLVAAIYVGFALSSRKDQSNDQQ
jgi:hypothetical protein